MNIKTIDYSYKNDKGHKVYEFYPERKFDGEIVVCPWFGEIKNHSMLPAIFAICDQSNIKLSVLSTEDNIPLFSFYSHAVISVTSEAVGVDTTWNEAVQKAKYLEKHTNQCYGGSHHSVKVKGWDLHWSKYCKEVGHKYYTLSCIPKIEHVNLFLSVLKNYTDHQTELPFCDSLNRFEESFVTEFYREHHKKYNIYFLENQIKSYESLVNDLNIDDSPKIFAYIKNDKHQGRRKLEEGECYRLGAAGCRRRAGMEYILSDIMGEALIEVHEEVGANKIYNFNFNKFKNNKESSGWWPFQSYIGFRGSLNSRLRSSLTSIQTLLSLNNGFSYVSQAGASSALYFAPVNILYAEHQHWVHYNLEDGCEFRKRPQQDIFNNPAVYDANDQRPIDKLVDKDISNEELFRKTEEYIKQSRDKDYFKSLFLNYLNG